MTDHATRDAALRAAAPARAEVLLRRVELRLARRLPGRLAGTHAGVGIGPGWSAESARAYQPGVDDVRHIDWTVTARMGEPYVRQFEAERELETTVVVDISPSMAFGTVEWPKRELAAAVVGAVGTLTSRPGDRMGAVLHDPAAPDGARMQRLAPRSGRPGRLMMVRRLLQSGSVPQVPASRRRMSRLRRVLPGRIVVERSGIAGETPVLADACRAAARQLRRPGLLVVVSDFLEPDLEALTAALRPLTARHTVLAVEVRDPFESELPDVGLMSVVDPETGASTLVDTGDAALRQAYAAVAAEHTAAVGEALRSARVGHVRVTTGSDWIAELARYVERTRRSRRP